MFEVIDRSRFSKPCKNHSSLAARAKLCLVVPAQGRNDDSRQGLVPQSTLKLELYRDVQGISLKRS